MEVKGLSIKGESIQSLYGSYLSKTFLVNRRYQRKLVWTIDEKREFIDSIINGYPVPLILLAETNNEKGRRLEIIDGLQRLNAIMSFIDQEFEVDDKYFNLDTMADTKLLKDQGQLKQKMSSMDREICANVVRYQIPLSVFQESGNSHVDEVFRRLNAGGRHLSKQELRQAGSVSKFATIVRKLASNIRGDSSVSDTLDLNAMKKISITNKNLNYGIAVDDIFWVKNNIITKEDLRQSKDEEVIADIVAWVSIEKGVRSSSSILNQLYDFGSEGGGDSDISLATQVETQINKVNEEKIVENIQYVFDKIIAIITKSNKTFNGLLFKNQQAKIARYFQIVFFAFYKLIIDDNLDVGDEKKLISLLDKSGDKVINLAAGGGNWSAKEKQSQTNALCGVLKECFVKSVANDPGRGKWITRFENLLMQSSTEQALYDFKLGFYSVKDKNSKFNKNAFSKSIKTLTAMANTLPGATGYCVVGVADKESSAIQHKKIYKSEFIKYSSFFVTGVDNEADRFHSGMDSFFTKLTQLVKYEPISDRDKDYISRNISVVKYFDKSVIILKICAGKDPSIYDEKYHVRHGSNISEVKASDFSELFSRFKFKKEGGN